ncbi:hypothetical protein HRU45_03875, partial [Candidatus Dependentiae bacterium]|nr:hypothetical protein [Candidatus Dependentiae bacterium]
FIAVLIYSKLVDKFKKEKLFYILCTFYGVIFLVITGTLIAYEAWGPQVIGKYPLAGFGWVSYFAIESFGSIVIALFWSYAASICTTDAAKVGYPFIVAVAQLSAIGASILNIFIPQIGSIWPIFLVATIAVALVCPIINKLVRTVPADQMVSNSEKVKDRPKKKQGFFQGMVQGLVIIATRPYIFGILIISTFYEVVATIVDYQLNSQASLVYTTPIAYARFTGIFGTCVNTLSFLVALLGFRHILKKYGLRLCLLLYPILLTAFLSVLYAYFLYGSPTSTQLLWATFGVMVVAKGLSYAINNPTKEMMYIPTSKDAKFKAKGFIDPFGGRSAKTIGAAINNTFKHDLSELMMYGTLISFGLIGVWIVAAIYVGQKNASLVKNNEIVG